MKILFMFALLFLVVGCTTQLNKKVVLKKLQFDDQIITSADWEKSKISFNSFNAELKFGEIIKVKPTIDEEFNRFSESSELKGNMQIYLNDRNIISVAMANGITMKQCIKDMKRYDVFFIPTRNGVDEAINIFEYENDTTVKILNYYKNFTAAPSESLDPLSKLESIDFKEEDFTLFAKQRIIINPMGMPKIIFMYHQNVPSKMSDQPAELFSYNNDGSLLRRVFGNDFYSTYSYKNGLLIGAVDTIIMSRGENGKIESTMVSNRKFDYFPNNIGWTKRVETRTSFYVEDSIAKPIIQYFILEKS